MKDKNKEFINTYWNYFLELEEQLLTIKRYVAFDKINYKTYSIEFLKLYQATCSEIDVVAKYIAEYFDPSFKKAQHKNIQKWGYIVHNQFPAIETISIRFTNDDVFIPWKNWCYEITKNKHGKKIYKLCENKNTPKWWTAYNKVKHERAFINNDNGKSNYTQANLSNLIYSLSALYVLETLFIDYLGINSKVYQKSKLFQQGK